MLHFGALDPWQIEDTGRGLWSMALERGSLNVPSLNEINSMGNLAIDFTFLYIRGP